jgi:hypothetical protein
MQMDKLLYGREEAAGLLSLSLRAIDYLISKGEIKTRKVGGRTLITIGALREFAGRDHPDRLTPLKKSEKAEKTK